MQAHLSPMRPHAPCGLIFKKEISGVGRRAEHSGHPQPGNPINHTMLKARQETWARCQTTSGKASSSTLAFCLTADWGEKVQNVCPVLCLNTFQCLVKITAREKYSPFSTLVLMQPHERDGCYLSERKWMFTLWSWRSSKSALLPPSEDLLFPGLESSNKCLERR